MNNTLINGIRVFSFSTRDELIDYVEKEKKSLIAINADKILHATEQTRNLINKNIGYPDGIGAVKALKKKGLKNAVKIPGVELWHEIVKRFYQSKTFYLIGGTEDVIDKTTEKLKNEFPGINIIGYRNGYLNNDQERLGLINAIAKQKPDIIFVAMGSPKQELLMQEMQQHHPAIYQGLGGSFDVYVGNVKRAPAWWIKNNLEGAYRLLMQPYKIKRYINALPFWWNLLTGKYN
ncbi:MAG: WecB/TagA/CpsF family glycosyltransferase [Bacilli bacterium]|nr:WecB/TagA/CpsF family glycosyltransferase [Bacilli bacterium]